MAENVTPVQLAVKDFEKREVLMIDYKFDQATDREGQIAGIPRGGRVTVFFNTVDGSTMKSLKGTGCYCVNYKESWEDGQEHFEEIEVVCQTLENGPVKFENPWK